MIRGGPGRVLAFALLACIVVFVSLLHRLKVSRSTAYQQAMSAEASSATDKPLSHSSYSNYNNTVVKRLSYNNTSEKRLSSNIPEKRPRLPKALIIGFPKCGTAALRTFLTIHPQIVSPVLEIRYFTENYSKGLEWYRNQMPPSNRKQITIEKTPSYIFEVENLKRIHEFNPKIKLIVIVRDPIVRLQSQYAHFYRSYPPGASRQSFKSWLIDDGNNNRILHFSKYVYYLTQTYRVFPRNQVLVVSEGDLEKNPVSVMQEVESFLGLKSEFSKDMFIFSKKKGFYCFNKDHELFPTIVKMVKVNNRTACLGGDKGREHPPIEESLRQRLVKLIRPYNERFFSLIKRKFEWENF